MPFGFGVGGGRGNRRRGRGSRGGGGWRRFGSRGPAGPPETCICPHCGKIVPHKRGLPCFQTTCPGCGTSMTRQFFQDQF